MTAVRSRKLKRPVFATVERLVRPETGEEILALVASMPVDKRAFREMGLKRGNEVVISVHKDRNRRFWGLAHILGGWLADNVPDFMGKTQHAAIKHLQEQSGIGCTQETYELQPPLVGTMVRNVAMSLNFVDMEETEFGELWSGGEAAAHEGGWLGWLRQNRWQLLSVEQIAEAEAIIEKPDSRA